MTGDLSQPILPQLRDLLLSLIEAPYSTFVSNLILVVLACALVVSGMVVRWITAHPNEFHRIIMGWRRRSRVRQAERHIRQALTFLLRRFDVVGTYGLSFTITLAALFAGIWFFGSALEDILAYNGTALFDLPVNSFLALHRTSWLTAVMQAMNIFGTGCAVILLVAGSAAYLLYRSQGRGQLVVICAASGGAEVLDLAMGFLIARPEPPPAFMVTSIVSCGFQPSQTAISVIYGVVAYLIAANRSSWRAKVFTWSGAVFVAFLIGVARIYLGMEWVTDTLSRWALALVWLSAVLVVMEIVEQPTGAARLRPEESRRLSPAADAPPEPSLTADFPRPGVSIDGLCEAEVAERYRRSEVNTVKERTSRGVADILRANVFTRFNALLGGLFVVILFISGKQDALFGLILVANTAIGVAQELRAKWTLDRLRVLVAPRARVVRDGVTSDIPVHQIVLDDVLEVHPGDQVSIDGILLAAQNLEVNESLLTGEADPVPRSRGDQVLSGSFVVAGSGRLQAVRIGEASYSRRVARVARQFSPARSQLRDGVNNILRYVGWALIPTATVLFGTQLLYSPAGVHDAAVTSIAGVVGMVPEGLVLLMSTVMAIAVVRLARREALVQELAAVELLARVDVVCCDKTGTLTEGALQLEEVLPANSLVNGLPADVRIVLGAFGHNQETQTASSTALRAACPPPAEPEWEAVSSVPFSSTRKWGALAFARHGNWILGAPEIVFANVDRAAELLATVGKLARRGKRVLALVSSKEPLDATKAASLPPSVEAEALIVLGEKIRTEVAATMRYFEEQGVAVKIVSGDHAETVQSVASMAGLQSGQLAIDGRSLPADPRELGDLVDRNSLFGRVTPAQKRQMMRALHDRGHVVAMIGDGINDILAIKEADFGIALGSGTAASRAVAQLILLNNSFATLPKVIAEGRQVIANVERTANLFITKTIYVFALALAIGVAQAPFPFLPRHLTLVGFLTIGVPGLFLSFARNTTVARSGFVPRVLRFAFPAGAIAAAATLLSYAAARALIPDSTGLARTAATLTLVGCGLVILLLLARPRLMGQWLFLAALPTLLAIVLGFSRLRAFFALELPPPSVWTATGLILGGAAMSLLMTARPDQTDSRAGSGT